MKWAIAGIFALFLGCIAFGTVTVNHEFPPSPIQPEHVDSTGFRPSLAVTNTVHNLGDLQKQPSKCTCFDCQCKTTPGNPLCNCGVCQCDEPEPTSKPITAYIEFHTSENCGYCQQWKQTELPRLTANGWKTGDNGHIRIIDHGANYEISLPLFRFYWHGKLVHQHTGYLTRAEIGTIFEGFKPRREVIQSRAARVPHEAVYRGARRPLAVTFAGCSNGVCR
jgi:hypothetical protein